MAVIYEVRAAHDGRVSSFGVRLTPDEAQALLSYARSIRSMRLATAEAASCTSTIVKPTSSVSAR